MRWRKTGSSAAVPPLTLVSAARAPRRLRLLAIWAIAPKARPARSFISVVIATDQPLPTPPTMFSSGIRASLMKTSLNSPSPVIWTSGLASTPGWSMSIRK